MRNYYKVNSKVIGYFVCILIGIIIGLCFLYTNQILNYLKSNEIYVNAIQLGMGTYLILRIISFIFSVEHKEKVQRKKQISISFLMIMFISILKIILL